MRRGGIGGGGEGGEGAFGGEMVGWEVLFAGAVGDLLVVGVIVGAEGGFGG